MNPRRNDPSCSPLHSFEENEETWNEVHMKCLRRDGKAYIIRCVPMSSVFTMNVCRVTRQFCVRPIVAKKIARPCYSGKQQELFLIGVPFSGGQVKTVFVY